MPRLSPQKPLGVEIRPRRLLFRGGNSQERLVLETAQGLPAWLLTALWPQLWIPVHGVALGKRPALGGLFNDLPAKNKANRLLAAAWMQQESRFLFPPMVWPSRQGIKEKVRDGVVRAGRDCHFGLSISLVPGYLGIGVWHFHPLNILVIPNSSISWAPRN